MLWSYGSARLGTKAVELTFFSIFRGIAENRACISLGFRFEIRLRPQTAYP